jgi:transcriptional regulator with XRE-family HTH domain
MRNYSPLLKARVRLLPKSDGTTLARLAVKRGFSVIRIARCTGATRQTVYNWFAGKQVTNAYKVNVKRLTTILNAASSGDDAWSTACTVFNLND